MTATSFIAADLDRLKTRSQAFMNDWLVGGLIAYANHDGRAFWPFLAVAATGEPVDGLLAFYRGGGLALQRKLRIAISNSCAALIPTSPSFVDVTPAIRRSIFRAVSTLIPITGAFDATPRLTASVIEHEAYWTEVGCHPEVFARAYRTCCDLAIGGLEHIDGSREKMDALESEILKLSAATGFRSEFAPIGIHALVSINPRRYLTRHRTSYGLHIRALHALDPTERNRAYITANLIVRKAQKELADVAPQLDIRSGGGDRWIVEALTSRKSESEITRTENPSEVQLTWVGHGERAGRPLVKTRLRNASFIHERFDFGAVPSSSKGKRGALRRNLTRALEFGKQTVLGLGSPSKF